MRGFILFPGCSNSVRRAVTVSGYFSYITTPLSLTLVLPEKRVVTERLLS